MADRHHFTRVDFERFKAFKKFSLKLRQFNVLVGPNNAGKSTVLAAFRIYVLSRRTNSPGDILGWLRFSGMVPDAYTLYPIF